jgi:hypothetical protein
LRTRQDLRKKCFKTVAGPVAVVLFLVTIFSGLMTFPNASAAGLPLTVGNVQFTINDFGVITNEISWNWATQTHFVYKSYLTILHDAYPVGGGGTDVATGYGSGTGDFTVDEANVYVQSNTVQETYASFTQTGVAGVSNDLKIYQTAFSKEGEDWAILVWKLENIYGTDISGLRVGMNFRTRLADSPGDDIDYWNAADSMYYIEDSTTGTTLMGLASADQSVPLNRYYGSQAGKAGDVDPMDDKTLYQALLTNQVHGAAVEISCMAGWEVGMLPAGANVTLPLLITFGTKYQDLSWSAQKAREFLVLQSIGLDITEIQDAHSTDNVKIEIYNDGDMAVQTADIYLSPDGLSVWNGGVWSTTTIRTGEYSVYSMGPGEAFPSTEGGKVSLHYTIGFKLDSVTFGQQGPAPDPLRDETIARYWNGLSYSNEWVRDPTPTFGARNDRPARLDPPPVVLNEIGFNMNQPQDRFIELYYPGSVTVSMTGWTIVVDDAYLLPPITLNPSKRYFVLRGNDFPINFGMDDGTTSGDNVYLYDGTGQLVDMVGWSIPHVTGQTMDRVSDQGQWGFDSFNDPTSTEDGWRFGRNPTPQILDMGPDQSMMVDVGQVAAYDVSVYYSGSSPDVMDITFASSLGWVTEITDPLGSPITDTDGDTVPDIGTMSVGNIKDLKVSVTAPMDPQSGNINTVYITATSSVNTNLIVTLILRTTAVIPPYVVLDEFANPETIWVEGSPIFPQETTITLNVTGAGTPLTWYVPQDTVFVIDNSGSMVWNDPANLRFSGAKDYVDMMKIPDRATTVWFTTSAFLVNGRHLSWNYPLVKSDIDSIPGAAGGTNIPSGMSIATDELMGYADPSHVQVEILLTDGKNSNAMNDAVALQEAQRAADEGIIIFTIGLLAGNDVNEVLLQQIADITGGEYHRAPTAAALQDIYLGIFQQIMNIAGTKIDDPMNPNPMIRNILPSYINYVPGSFRDEISDPLPPDTITVNPDGSTTLDWDVDKIFINETWIAKFEVTSTLDGHIPANIYPESRVNYTKWDNSTEMVSFPETLITVLLPEPVNPPILGISADQNDVHLSWTIPGPNISYYLIYRSPDQRNFDFSSPHVSTQSDPNPTRTDWTDVGAATLSPREYYYAVRAVNNVGIKSITSNTVGKFTKSFDAGLNSFSLPLEPLVANDIGWYASSIPNTVYIDWMDSTDHWVRHWAGGPVTRPGTLAIGEGFQMEVSAPTTFTFVGTPAAMIKYQEGLGADLNFRKGLATMTIQDDLKLFWKPTPGSFGYLVYRADDRMAFHQTAPTPIATVGPSTTDWTDFGALSSDSVWYYMVAPLNAVGKEGSSTYSIGVVTVTYKEGHNSMGLPLKPAGWWTLDYYCESIQRTTGMAYVTMGLWKFHATEMPAGVYDPFIEQGEGYQLSVDGQPTRFTYVGY